MSHRADRIPLYSINPNRLRDTKHEAWSPQRAVWICVKAVSKFLPGVCSNWSDCLHHCELFGFTFPPSAAVWGKLIKSDIKTSLISVYWAKTLKLCLSSTFLLSVSLVKTCQGTVPLSCWQRHTGRCSDDRDTKCRSELFWTTVKLRGTDKKWKNKISLEIHFKF